MFATKGGRKRLLLYGCNSRRPPHMFRLQLLGLDSSIKMPAVCCWPCYMVFIVVRRPSVCGSVFRWAPRVVPDCSLSNCSVTAAVKVGKACFERIRQTGSIPKAMPPRRTRCRLDSLLSRAPVVALVDRGGAVVPFRPPRCCEALYTVTNQAHGGRGDFGTNVDKAFHGSVAVPDFKSCRRAIPLALRLEHEGASERGQETQGAALASRCIPEGQCRSG